jgi:coenzyme F420 hydrogenase subunit beta
MQYSTDNKTYIPFVDSAKCNRCGICLNVCPGETPVNFAACTQQTSSSGELHTTWGTFTGCYLGYATDTGIRQCASSGGIIPAFAKQFLNAHKSAAALSTAMDSTSPFETRAQLCKNFGSYLETSGSKYCPAATNSALAQLKGSGIQHLLCIGLPCHLQGIKKAQNKPFLKNLDSVVSIGLLCGGMRGIEATKWVVKSRGYKVKNVEHIRYRGNGWPGFMKVTFKDRSPDMIIPYPDYCDEFFGSWQPVRCSLCLDRTAQCADISVGDAWLEELKGDNNGWSVIVTRSERGEKLLHAAVKNNYLTISEMSADMLFRSQKGLNYLIQKNLIPTVNFYQTIHKSVPIYQLPPIKLSLGDCLKIIIRDTQTTVLRTISASVFVYKVIKTLKHILLRAVFQFTGREKQTNCS